MSYYFNYEIDKGVNNLGFYYYKIINDRAKFSV